MRYVTLLVAAGLILTVSATAGATTWLDMDITGVIHSDDVPGAQVGEWMQVGPIGPNGNFAWGTITSYSAGSDLPQNAGDLDMYGWSMQGTVDSIVGYVISSSGTGYLMAPGYGYDSIPDEYLEKFTWTMAASYNVDWSVAVVTGTLTAEVGDRQPTGWPELVDWSSAGTGSLNGTFTSSDNTLVANVVIPEPLTMLGVFMGIAGLAGYVRKRKLA